MELKQQEKVFSDASICCDGLPHLSAKYPWWFVQDMEDLSHNIFYNLHDPLSQYQCRIPELVGRRIRGCFHGWLILTNHPHNNLWSLWNPSSTSNIVSLPPLFLKDGDYDSIQECCLSAPPDDPTSVLLLTITNKPTFVFCQLTCKRNKKLRNKPRWTEMSYAYQLKRITGEDGSTLVSLNCCNGKVYALNINNSFTTFIIWVDIVFKDREVLIKLSLLGACPSPLNYCSDKFYFLRGSCTELFYITLSFDVNSTDIKTLGSVDCCKLDMTSIKCEDVERFKGLDMTSMRWEERKLEDLQDLRKSLQMWERMVDLKNAIIFLDFDHCLVFYRPEIDSELGGYIHIREGKIIYSYHVKDNTVSLSSMPSLVLPTSHVSLWECRLDNDHGEAKCIDYSKQEEDEIVVRAVTDDQVGFTKSCLLNIPFDVLEMIMKYCVGVEYMNFRAVCKLCHLAAPLIQWRSKTTLRRLQPYSLVSPWLMVVDKNRGIFTFTDPVLGDKYHMKNSHLSILNGIIHCSRFGWLLFESSDFNCLVFFNPFTNDLRKLPNVDDYHIRSACFSGPPTSPDCMVVGFTNGDELNVLIHFVAQAPSWRILCLGAGPYSIRCPTFVGRNLYALCNKGELIAFEDLGQEDYSWKLVEAGAPRRSCKYPAQYYLMNCDQHLLLVSVGNLGERVEVLRWNDSTEKWEKIDGLGKHVTYICGTSCLCIQAKTPEMENTIYMPRLHSKSKKIVFYSLETHKYDASNGKNIQEHFEDFLGTTYHLSDSIWVEPSWS